MQLRGLLPVFTLLLAIFMFMAGSGALPAILGLRLESGGYSAPVIALVGSSYFAGLTIGSLLNFRIIRMAGHIRAFAAFVSLFSASVLAYGLVESLPFWIALRLIDGISVAGVFICLESWLNLAAEPKRRGSTLAFYMIALYSGQALAQMQLSLPADRPHLPFILASLVLSLTVLPVALTRMAAPVLDDQHPSSVRRLYGISPLGLVGSAATGLMIGAFYSLGAVQANRLGFTGGQTALLIGCVIGGGMALQWPLGMLSDRYDRRSIIVVTLLLTAATALAMGLVSEPITLVALGALFGGFCFALYPLCVAHTNDHVDVSERTGASGGLILAYSGGAALGPLLGAVAMRLLGPEGLYLYIAACAALVCVFGLWRQIVAAPVPGPLQRAFQILPRTTPMAAAMDPELPVEEGEAEAA